MLKPVHTLSLQMSSWNHQQAQWLLQLHMFYYAVCQVFTILNHLCWQDDVIQIRMADKQNFWNLTALAMLSWHDLALSLGQQDSEADTKGSVSRAHTPKNEVFSSQYLMLPAERTCSN